MKFTKIKQAFSALVGIFNPKPLKDRPIIAEIAWVVIIWCIVGLVIYYRREL